ncbi:hypothetical protein [Flavobacterium aestivum]|uniref:hypothetical protein n=1 Tax=Flavobacterium aestivum TaxID=3003257 RepID=UPI0024830DFE|nr:hypothetical protein [Flavobacterium aestivum]
MEVSITKFIKSGFFGQISLGDSRERICRFFNIVEELKEYDYVRFNNLELKFFDNELVLISFFINHAGIFFVNNETKNPFYINDFEVFKNIKLSEFEKYCSEQNLEIKNKYNISNETSLNIDEDVYITFENDILNSISVFDLNKI